MSIELMTKVWKESDQKGNHRLCLLALADSANDEGFCWPGIKSIARKINASTRYTQLLIRDLEAAGEVETIEREGHHETNMYYVHPGVYRCEISAEEWAAAEQQIAAARRAQGESEIAGEMNHRSGGGRTIDQGGDDPEIARGVIPNSYKPPCEPSSNPHGTTTMPPATDQPIPTGVGGGGSEADASMGKRAATRPGNAPSPNSAPPSPPLGCNPPDPASNTYDYLRQQGVSKKRAAEFAHLDRDQIASWWETEQRRDPDAPAGRLVLRLEGSPTQFQAPPPPTPAGDKYPRPEWATPEEWAAICTYTPTMAANLEGSRWENGQLVGATDYATQFYQDRGYAERIASSRATQRRAA